VVVLVAAKALGYAVSLGAGFRGGPVFPAIFLGIGLATFAVELLDVSPTLAVAVGTAAGMPRRPACSSPRCCSPPCWWAYPASTRIPAAVFAGSAAWLVRTALDRRLSPAPAAG
jgi:hypothetical protein